MDFAKLLRLGMEDDTVKIKKEDLQMLQEMFKGSDFTASVYATVLKENQGSLDSAVDTLLNLANDPLRDERKEELQAPLTSKPIAIDMKKEVSIEELLLADEQAEGDDQQPEVMLSPRHALPMTDRQLEQEDARLLEEMRLLDEEKRVGPQLGSSPGATLSPRLHLVASPAPHLSASPIAIPPAPIVSSPPKEVLSVLQTQEIMSNELVPAAVAQPSSDASAQAGTQRFPAPHSLILLHLHSCSASSIIIFLSSFILADPQTVEHTCARLCAMCAK